MKVTFDVSSGRLVIEGDGPELVKVLEIARDIAPNISQIQIITAKDKSTSEGGPKENPPQERFVPQSGPTTLRQFVRALSLENLSERIAAIAYYVNKIEGKPHFSPKEMDGWFTMCGLQKPAQMPLALYDAKRKYGRGTSDGRFFRLGAQGSLSDRGELLLHQKPSGRRPTASRDRTNPILSPAANPRRTRPACRLSASDKRSGQWTHS